MRVLVLREREAAERTGACLAAQGHVAIVAPLTTIVPLEGQALPPDVAALLLTSPAAARMLAARPDAAGLLALPVLAVGDRTAEAAREAGFADLRSAAGDAAALADLARRTFPPGARLLYPAAQDRSRDLAGELGRHGLTVLTAPIYAARTARRMPADAAAALRAGDIDAVLHYSGRAARAFLALGGKIGLGACVLAPAHLCLSERIAAPLRRAGARKIHIADTPNEKSLLALLVPDRHVSSDVV